MRVGKKVMVISDCMTNGCVGTVLEESPNKARVKLDSVPDFYDGNNPATYSPKSLQLVPNIDYTNISGSTKPPLRIGVVFGSPYVAEDLDTVNCSNIDSECVVIRAETKEDCIEILNKMIEDGDADWAECDYLAFNDRIYELEETKTMKIHSEV